MSMFNLPSYTKGKTFAEASKAIEAKFKDRTDKVSTETKQELLERLANAQEYLKLSQSSPIGNPTEMKYGGSIVKYDGISNSTGFLDKMREQSSEALENAGMDDYLGGATTALDFGNQIFGKTSIDQSGMSRQDAGNTTMNTVNTTLQGVKAGSQIGGPIGGAIGGIVGLGTGIIGGKRKKDEVNIANHRNTLAQRLKYGQSDFALGGALNGTDPKTLPIQTKFPAIHLPNNPDPLKQEDLLDAYQKQKKLSNQQVTGFQDQRETDQAYKTNRQKFYADKFKAWRSGMTGVSPNSKFTQGDPEYAKFWENTENEWYKNNPRQINDVVVNYRNNGPVGTSDNSRPQFNDNAYGGYSRIKKGIKSYEGNKPYSSYINKQSNQNDDTFANYSFGQDMNINPNPGPYRGMDKTSAGKALDWMGENYGNILRYAPIVGNLTDKLEQPTTPRGSRLTNVYKPNKFDEASLINQVNQNNVDAALKEASAGNLGALRNSLLGSNLNKTKALGDAFAKASNINREEERFAFQTGLDKDKTNVMLDRDFLVRKAQDLGAYNTAKSAKRSALFEDIGKIGKEETYKKMAKEMFGYTWKGSYWVDSKGKRVSDETVRTQLQNLNKKDGNNS